MGGQMIEGWHNTLRGLAEETVAVTAVGGAGGAGIWALRKALRFCRRMNDLYNFLVGDCNAESLVDRIVKEEFRSRFMMMYAKDSVYECDTQGMCTYVNPQMAKMFGIAASEAIGQGWLIALQPDERQRVWDAWQRAAGNGVPYEATFTLKSGRRVKTIAHVCYSAENKKPLYYIGVVWDAQSAECPLEECL